MCFEVPGPTTSDRVIAEKKREAAKTTNDEANKFSNAAA